MVKQPDSVRERRTPNIRRKLRTIKLPTLAIHVRPPLGHDPRHDAIDTVIRLRCGKMAGPADS